jgi:NTP pyrophosphatase (non-canonical NTP hydrolase)
MYNDLVAPALTLNHYQEQAATTAIYPQEVELEYLSLGLCSEAGEFAGKIAKWYRKDNDFPRGDVIDELGDVLWFIAQMANHLEVPLSVIATNNLKKLASRQDRGVLQGSGDNR